MPESVTSSPASSCSVLRVVQLEATPEAETEPDAIATLEVEG